MKCSVFNLPSLIAIYPFITSNNCNNDVPPVLLLYRDTTGIVLEEELPNITQFPPVIIN